MECFICNENFDSNTFDLTPLLIACGHTFCRKCLTTMSKNKNECPFDKTIFDKNINDLKKNFALLDLMDKKEKPLIKNEQTKDNQKENKKTETYCDQCFELINDKSDSFCLECNTLIEENSFKCNECKLDLCSICIKDFEDISAENQSIKQNLQCEKCMKNLIFMNKIEEYCSDIYICDKCSHHLNSENGVWHCSCGYDVCNLCSLGLDCLCDTCNNPLIYTVSIPNYKGKYYICNVCDTKLKIKNGAHHCFYCGDFDLCIKCRSNRILN